MQTRPPIRSLPVSAQAVSPSQMPFPSTGGASGEDVSHATVRPSTYGGYVASITVAGVTYQSEPQASEQMARADLRLVLRRRPR